MLTNDLENLRIHRRPCAVPFPEIEADQLNDPFERTPASCEG